MNFETWITYVIACAVLSIIPGPSVLLITGQALTKGLRAAFICLAGETLGGAILILLSLLGVGAVLATSSVLFLIIKWLGVTYLAYLGISQIINAQKQNQEPSINIVDIKINSRGSFSSGFVTALFNPKAIIFYMAFLTQFFDPLGNHLIQYTILIITSAVVAGLILAIYAVVASQVRSSLKGRKAKRNVNYASGSFYLGGSMLMATTK
jgi:threonine/homoserine/homoserine lactone efflux protein